MHHDVYDYFGRVVTISLDRRSDRWRRFLRELPPDWPFKPPVRFPAIDGSKVPPPPSWIGGEGAWGCFLSHCQVIRDCIEDGVDSALILEDDAIMSPDFAEYVRHFIAELPTNWGLAYLGGQHIHMSRGLPSQISEWVYRPFNVNRMHAYAIQGRGMMRRVLEFVTDEANWTEAHHIDHFLGAFQERYPALSYAPKVWLAAQMEGKSNISGRNLGFRVFQTSEDICHPKVKLPIVCILGNYGESACLLAGALHAAGISMGQNFETDCQQRMGNFESTGINELCQLLIDETKLCRKSTDVGFAQLLRVWASSYTQNLLGVSELAGVRHPLLLCLFPEIVNAWDGPMFLVAIGSTTGAVAAVIKRNQGLQVDTAMNITNALDATLQHLTTPKANRLKSINTDRLLEHPSAALDEIYGSIGFQPSALQRNAAVRFVRDWKK